MRPDRHPIHVLGQRSVTKIAEMSSNYFTFLFFFFRDSIRPEEMTVRYVCCQLRLCVQHPMVTRRRRQYPQFDQHHNRPPFTPPRIHVGESNVRNVGSIRYPGAGRRSAIRGFSRSYIDKPRNRGSRFSGCRCTQNFAYTKPRTSIGKPITTLRGNFTLDVKHSIFLLYSYIFSFDVLLSF